MSNDNTCPCNEARQRAEKANEQAQRALHDLHHTTVKGLQGELAQLRTELAAARGHNGSNINNGTHPVHPEYGPCDGFAPGGMCSVCLDVIQGLRTDLHLSAHERETALREYEQLLQSHTAQTKMIDAMEADLRGVQADLAAAHEEIATLHQAAHMPADYEYGVPTWINMVLYMAYIGLDVGPHNRAWAVRIEDRWLAAGDANRKLKDENAALLFSNRRLLRAVAVLCRRGERALKHERKRLAMEWLRILDWLIEDTEKRRDDRAEPNPAFYVGKYSALTYLRTLAVEDVEKVENNGVVR